MKFPQSISLAGRNSFFDRIQQCCRINCSPDLTLKSRVFRCRLFFCGFDNDKTAGVTSNPHAEMKETVKDAVGYEYDQEPSSGRPAVFKNQFRFP